MKLSRLSSLTAIALTAGLLSQAHAVSVPGKKNNCSAVWDTGPATATISTTAKPSSLTCTDGDPTCDADGLPNGTCVISLNACVGQASDGCTPGTLSTLTFNAPITKKGLLTGFVAPSATTPGCWDRRLDQPRPQAHPEEHQQAAQEVEAVEAGRAA